MVLRYKTYKIIHKNLERIKNARKKVRQHCEKIGIGIVKHHTLRQAVTYSDRLSSNKYFMYYIKKMENVKRSKEKLNFLINRKKIKIKIKRPNFKCKYYLL